MTKSLIEQKILEAMRSGEFSKLSGEGKPLKLDDDAHVPEHLRMAHKILRENDLAPEWILEGRGLDDVRREVLDDLRSAARVYVAGRAHYANAESRWYEARQIYREAAASFNRKALTYNLKTPTGVAHKALIEVEREIQRALERAEAQS